ncbi:hypothetical protein MFRU_019g01640 [Monilinia fructicola]|uniref:N-acetyltransferase domain-containing protein n=1 Tax=Monilinia fructicola TaxID=38448 RepID=A0A5M9JC64_MONFR|nr:hypothetical protein EYC84_008791 [Monilinia fructicola]KAG4028879.1 hypothetical protein MFRU_019g01640 [Monilinia fructicola]
MENLSKKKGNATMRTYSKRTRGGTQDFSIKRQRVDSSEFVSTSSSIFSESSFSTESHFEDRSGEANSSPLISSPSDPFQDDSKYSSSTKSRVLTPRSNRSTSPLIELNLNHQNRRDNGISPSNLSNFLKLKSSTKVKGDNFTSAKEILSFTPDSRTNSRSQHKRRSTLTESSCTPKLSSPTRRNLASSRTSNDLDSLQQNTYEDATIASHKILVTSLSNNISKENIVLTPKSQPLEKVNKSSILSYFKPLPQSSSITVPERSSSPLKSQSSILSDPPQQKLSSPPSSPPSLPQDTLNLSRSRTVRRRISTKPNLPNINKMSEYFDNDMQEIGGDFTDDSRVEMIERYHDAQDMRDHAIIDHGTLIPLSEQALDIPARVKLEADLARPKPFALHQQILDLGQSFHNKCQNCGMQYAINIATDRSMHDKFHNVFRMGGPTFKPKYDKTQIWTKVIEGEKHSIQCIGCKESIVIRNLVESILEATLMDMDGTLPSTEQMWSMITSPNDPKDLIPVPRYKVFLYLIGARPIGILLAERIGKANAITAAPETENIIPLPQDAYMCIDRLWVHSDFRRKGIATSLANQARKKFIPGLVIEKKEVAISQPTSVGSVFAEKYFKGVFEGARFAVGYT